MKKPYIGITGFMKKVEVLDVLSSMPERCDRLLMVGVLASRKTLYGLGNKWPNRYPKAGDIYSIFVNDSRALNLIHYAADSADGLYEDMMALTDLSGANCHGLQLNIAWPPPETLYEYRKEHPKKVIVLQVGLSALSAISNSPAGLAKKVFSEYSHLIDYVLLDPSGGQGKSLDAEITRAYIEHLGRVTAPLDVVLAGGLGPAGMAAISALAAAYPWISIDAEGRLRNSCDSLDLSIARSYLAEAIEIFKKK